MSSSILMSFGHATQPSPYPLDLCRWFKFIELKLLEINTVNEIIWFDTSYIWIPVSKLKLQKLKENVTVLRIGTMKCRPAKIIVTFFA